jgi:hypothetical protein
MANEAAHPRLIAASLLLMLSWSPPVRGDVAGDLKQQIEKRYNIELVTDSAPRELHWWTLLGPEDRDALNQYLQIFEREFMKHDPVFVRNSGLKRVVFVKDYVVDGDRRAGGYDTDEGLLSTRYVCRTRWIISATRSTTSSTTSSRSALPLRNSSNPKWMLYNLPGWQYGQGGAAANRAAHQLRLDLGEFNHTIPGFINLYSRTSMAEDQAELFAVLYMPERLMQVEQMASTDPLLKQKLTHLRRFIAYYREDRPLPIIGVPRPEDEDYQIAQFLHLVANNVLFNEHGRARHWVSEPRFINEKGLDDWRPLHWTAAFGRAEMTRGRSTPAPRSMPSMSMVLQQCILRLREGTRRSSEFLSPPAPNASPQTTGGIPPGICRSTARSGALKRCAHRAAVDRSTMSSGGRMLLNEWRSGS